MLKRAVLAGLLALLPLLAVFAAAPAYAQDKTITVFAAASMKNAVDDINAAFTKATGIKAVTSYAASSALAKQIEQSAPADVFASANLDWMDHLENKNLIAKHRVNLLGNQLVSRCTGSKIGEVKIGQADLARIAATDVSPPATCARCRLENARRRLKSSAPGRWRRQNSRWPITCARRWCWSGAARPARVYGQPKIEKA
jgi:ABC-type molybdate transport system substrate-binding protein